MDIPVNDNAFTDTFQRCESLVGSAYKTVAKDSCERHCKEVLRRNESDPYFREKIVPKEAMFCGALKTMCEEANICFAHLGYTHPNFEFKGAVVRDDFRVETWGVDTAGNRVSACPLRLIVHV